MSPLIDLSELRRESETVEWKENVADIDDVVATLCAFANDLANLGGGYVVCGAREEKDEYGFPQVVSTGLTAQRLAEVEGTVLTRCRERVHPAITPLVEELPAGTPDRRLLVFLMPASTRTAHSFRRQDGSAGKYYVRIGRQTREARNGLLLQLLVKQGVVEPWDRRPCAGATVADLDLVAVRDTLQRLGVYDPDRELDHYLSATNAISPFVPSLCVKEPLTGVLRPRNFALLLFGRKVQTHIPGAIAYFSTYPGQDRAEPRASRHELAGNLLEQARQLGELLARESPTIFDKEDTEHPNQVRYPLRALQEAMVNALAHRDYEKVDPTRITAFADRIEMVSPGPLPPGVELAELREGKASPIWRNQSLAFFLNRLELAQAEGQGIKTILRSMAAEGCPPPTFDADEAKVVCVLPANPRSLGS